MGGGGERSNNTQLRMGHTDVVSVPVIRPAE